MLFKEVSLFGSQVLGVQFLWSFAHPDSDYIFWCFLRLRLRIDAAYYLIILIAEVLVYRILIKGW